MVKKGAQKSVPFATFNKVLTFLTATLLHLFSFADTFRGLYHDSIRCAKQSYPSSGYWVS